MVCSAAISSITVRANDSTNSFSVFGTIEVLPDCGRCVVASFNNLTENRKYTTSVHIQYSGGVEQNSPPVDTSMCSYELLMKIIFVRYYY